MSKPYDSTADILDHKRLVEGYLTRIASELYARGLAHDDSKLEPPEKETFDQAAPALQAAEITSKEYGAALAKMGEGLAHHYEANRHHPEHFEQGVNEMNLSDIIEMVADWKAAAGAKGQAVKLDYLAGRFGIDAQLLAVIQNTLLEMES
jgi:hypothetical protein